MLLFDMMVDCNLMEYTKTDDDCGSYAEAWTDGDSFKAAIIKNTTTEMQIAEKQGISEAFTVVVNKGFTLEYHDVFKRVSDGAIFRVTSRTVDSESHPASTVEIAKVTAERWELPSEDNSTDP